MATLTMVGYKHVWSPEINERLDNSRRTSNLKSCMESGMKNSFPVISKKEVDILGFNILGTSRATKPLDHWPHILFHVWERPCMGTRLLSRTTDQIPCVDILSLFTSTSD